ncbi:hypothetical protein MMC34_003899 [Xylographa carneopallida]|nr:hypothetical protein [Xylographa carneopallida]
MGHPAPTPIVELRRPTKAPIAKPRAVIDNANCGPLLPKIYNMPSWAMSECTLGARTKLPNGPPVATRRGCHTFLASTSPAPQYDTSSDARVWALEVLELMAWEGRVHLPQPAAFFANYDELMRHAGRWQFQLPYTQAIVNGEETATPIRSRDHDLALGLYTRMTLSIESVESSDSSDSDLEPLLHGRGPDDSPLPAEYGPIPNPGYFGPQRMLDLYNNFIEDPDAYWTSDERILTFDGPPAPPPYGPHQQDELHPAHESLAARASHPDLVNAFNNGNDWQAPHGTPPSCRTSGPFHPHRHPPGPGPWDPSYYGDGDFAAALYATLAPAALEAGGHSSPATPILTIRNGVPSPEESPPRSRDSASPETLQSAMPPPPPPPPSPNLPRTPRTPLLAPSPLRRPATPPLFALPPAAIPLPASPPPLSPHLLPLPSSPTMPPPPIPPLNPNRSGLFGIVPRFPLPRSDEEEEEAEPVPDSPPPAYVSRKDEPPGRRWGSCRRGRRGSGRGRCRCGGRR